MHALNRSTAALALTASFITGCTSPRPSNMDAFDHNRSKIAATLSLINQSDAQEVNRIVRGYLFEDLGALTFDRELKQIGSGAIPIIREVAFDNHQGPATRAMAIYSLAALQDLDSKERISALAREYLTVGCTDPKLFQFFEACVEAASRLGDSTVQQQVSDNIAKHGLRARTTSDFFELASILERAGLLVEAHTMRKRGLEVVQLDAMNAGAFSPLVRFDPASIETAQLIGDRLMILENAGPDLSPQHALEFEDLAHATFNLVCAPSQDLIVRVLAFIDHHPVLRFRSPLVFGVGVSINLPHLSDRAAIALTNSLRRTLNDRKDTLERLPSHRAALSEYSYDSHLIGLIQLLAQSGTFDHALELVASAQRADLSERVVAAMLEGACQIAVEESATRQGQILSRYATMAEEPALSAAVHREAVRLHATLWRFQMSNPPRSADDYQDHFPEFYSRLKSDWSSAGLLIVEDRLALARAEVVTQLRAAKRWQGTIPTTAGTRNLSVAEAIDIFGDGPSLAEQRAAVAASMLAQDGTPDDAKGPLRLLQHREYLGSQFGPVMSACSRLNPKASSEIIARAVAGEFDFAGARGNQLRGIQALSPATIPAHRNILMAVLNDTNRHYEVRLAGLTKLEGISGPDVDQVIQSYTESPIDALRTEAIVQQIRHGGAWSRSSIEFCFNILLRAVNEPSYKSFGSDPKFGGAVACLMSCGDGESTIALLRAFETLSMDKLRGLCGALNKLYNTPQSRAYLLAALSQAASTLGEENRAELEQYAAALVTAEQLGITLPFRVAPKTLVHIINTRIAPRADTPLVNWIVGVDDWNGAFSYLEGPSQFIDQNFQVSLFEGHSDEIILTCSNWLATGAGSAVPIELRRGIVYSAHGSRGVMALSAPDPRMNFTRDDASYIDISDMDLLAILDAEMAEGYFKILESCSTASGASDMEGRRTILLFQIREALERPGLVWGGEAVLISGSMQYEIDPETQELTGISSSVEGVSLRKPN